MVSTLLINGPLPPLDTTPHPLTQRKCRLSVSPRPAWDSTAWRLVSAGNRVSLSLCWYFCMDYTKVPWLSPDGNVEVVAVVVVVVVAAATAAAAAAAVAAEVLQVTYPKRKKMFFFKLLRQTFSDTHRQESSDVLIFVIKILCVVTKFGFTFSYDSL